jgi:hypothetical protein
MLTNVLSTSITNKNTINNNATYYTDTGRQGKGEVFLALNDYFLCLLFSIILTVVQHIIDAHNQSALHLLPNV